MPYKDPAKARECAKRSLQLRRAANPEAFRKQYKEYRKRNLEKCRKAQREWYHRNITQERAKYRAWLRAKLGVIPTRAEPQHCEICGRLPDAHKALCLDHCHLSEKFRGWICTDCNLMLGYARDNCTTLRNAAIYLDAARR